MWNPVKVLPNFLLEKALMGIHEAFDTFSRLIFLDGNYPIIKHFIGQFVFLSHLFFQPFQPFLM